MPRLHPRAQPLPISPLRREAPSELSSALSKAAQAVRTCLGQTFHLPFFNSIYAPAKIGTLLRGVRQVVRRNAKEYLRVPDVDEVSRRKQRASRAEAQPKFALVRRDRQQHLAGGRP